MAAGAIVGGFDRIRGNCWGYGAKFEEGFQLLGSTALSMAGMICLAPVLADILGKAVIPFYRMIGVDPGMFGSLLAIDMGGYQLAKELAVFWLGLSVSQLARVKLNTEFDVSHLLILYWPVNEKL